MTTKSYTTSKGEVITTDNGKKPLSGMETDLEFHVNWQSGFDSNPGTAEFPFQSIRGLFKHMYDTVGLYIDKLVTIYLHGNGSYKVLAGGLSSWAYNDTPGLEHQRYKFWGPGCLHFKSDSYPSSFSNSMSADLWAGAIDIDFKNIDVEIIIQGFRLGTPHKLTAEGNIIVNGITGQTIWGCKRVKLWNCFMDNTRLTISNASNVEIEYLCMTARADRSDAVGLHVETWAKARFSSIYGRDYKQSRFYVYYGGSLVSNSTEPNFTSTVADKKDASAMLVLNTMGVV